MTKKKGVLYVRVSTTKFEQESSFEIQEQALKQICESKDIEIIDTYTDKSTGTRIRKRKGFVSMLYDAGIDVVERNDKAFDDFIINHNRKPKFNHIIVKDVFRFSRNNIEALQIIKELRDNGVYVHFINSGKDTITDDYETTLSILFTIAKSESYNTSRRIRFSKRSQAKSGKYNPARLPYGYKRIVNDKGEKEIVVDEDQAKIVRYIYDKYATDGGHVISQILNDSGVPTQQGGKWSDDKVHRIINNSIYHGVAVMQKWTKDDVTDVHFRKADSDRHVAIHDAVPPIVTKEQFDELQIIRKQRTNSVNSKGKRIVKDDIFYQKLYCKKCGARFVRHVGKGNKVTYMCQNRRKFGTNECDCRGIAYNSLVKFINQITFEQDDTFLDKVYTIFNIVVNKAKSRIKNIDDEINTKIELLDIDINNIARKFLTASSEMEIELNKLMQQLKEEKNNLLNQKQNLNIKVFDDLLEKVKNKKLFIDQLYKKEIQTFDEKIKLLKDIWIDSNEVSINITRMSIIDEVLEFNQLVEGTDLVLPFNSGYYSVNTFKR